MNVDWSLTRYAKENINCQDFWYDLSNQYLEPEKMLVDPRAVHLVKSAILILEKFEEVLEENELLN